MSTDPVLFEVFTLYSAWGTLVEYVSRSTPLDADPQSIFGAACACDRDRLAALLYGHHHGESLEDSEAILAELLAMASVGRRPRWAAEAGLFPELFERRDRARPLYGAPTQTPYVDPDAA